MSCTQAWISLVEPDRLSVRSRRKINELLQVLPAWRRRRILGELEQQVENLADILREIRNVIVESTVVHGKETDLVIFKWHELRKVRSSNFIQVFGRAVSPRAQNQLHLDEGKFRFDRQDHQEWELFGGAGDVRSGRHGLNLLDAYAFVSSVEIHRVDKMLSRPLDESVCVIGDRSGCRIVDMPEDGFENWPRVLAEISHEL